MVVKKELAIRKRPKGQFKWRFGIKISFCTVFQKLDCLVWAKNLYDTTNVHIYSKLGRNSLFLSSLFFWSKIIPPKIEWKGELITYGICFLVAICNPLLTTWRNEKSYIVISIHRYCMYSLAINWHACSKLLMTKHTTSLPMKLKWTFRLQKLKSKY